MKKVATILLALVPLAFAADEIAWGPPDDGLRMGIALDQSTQPIVLRVLIQNSSKETRSISLDWLSGCALAYPAEFRFTATSPEGKSVVLIDRIEGDKPIIGQTCPRDIKVEAGTTHEFATRELTRLAQNEYPPPLEPTTLDALLKAGYVLRVPADLSDHAYGKQLWKLVSGELRVPASPRK